MIEVLNVRRWWSSYRVAQYAQYSGHSPNAGAFFFGLFIGTLIVGPIIWTPLGRQLALALIKKVVKPPKK